MYLLGAASYLHTLWRSRAAQFADPADHETSKKLLWFLTIVATAGAVSGIVSISLAPVVGLGANVALGLATFALAILMILVSERSLAQIYKNNYLYADSDDSQPSS